MIYKIRDIELGRTCHFCHGTASVDTAWDDNGEPIKMASCAECDGLGVNITEDGSNLIDFIKKIAENHK